MTCSTSDNQPYFSRTAVERANTLTNYSIPSRALARLPTHESVHKRMGVERNLVGAHRPVPAVTIRSLPGRHGSPGAYGRSRGSDAGRT